MNPIYKLRHKIQMLKDFLQLLSTGPVTVYGGGGAFWPTPSDWQPEL